MKLNNLVRTNKKKIRPGRGIGSGKGKTSGRGHRGQMPLFRRLPKRGFKSLQKENIAILNLSKIQNFVEQKKINVEESLDLKLLQNKKIVSKKYEKLKILGSGEIKNKVNLTVNFISKQAKEKIEKIGGKLTLIKK